ncbi:uncharacterized protein LOC125801734 [Astyanax mexicanus]|uniref:uncharacterized protein LOC125785561 n=1 Tax=Astyanax mexicanus TaxID=7994 RepID=UPI0020CB44AA|nr:uncharacterized protein LOC125785561 [Astyanax mexicanus]XP_049333894.1 uncharacterized protein LOC125801352 [Astyanax mexicanus]XP_049334931.1 uncharacterized protein LOC125801734 [Astyanax mexicanus]
MPWTAEPSDIPAVDDWMRRSEEVWEETHRRIETVLQRQKQQADRLRRETPLYSPGDRVWLSTRDFRQPDMHKKLSAKYIGPFKIIKRINEVTYRLDLPSHYRVCPSFHVSLLKPVIPGPLDETSLGAPPPPPVAMEGGPVYAVERLLDSRRRRGTLEYLVDWRGYGPEERSWVPATDVLDPLMVEDFHRSHPSRPAPRPRGRPRRRSPVPRRGRRRGSDSVHSLSSVRGSRRGRPRSRVSVHPVPASGQPVQVATGGDGVVSLCRPHPLLPSDSLEGGTVTQPGSPSTLPDSISQNSPDYDINNNPSHSPNHVTLRRSDSPVY